jgi:hypothetical protein
LYQEITVSCLPVDTRTRNAINGYWLLVLMLAVACIHVAAARGQDQYADERRDWQSLFDGTTLDGWVQRGGSAAYEVVDGMIVGTAVANSPNSFLCTERMYGDFELELEFWVDDGLNSGIQIRSAHRDDFLTGRVHGYQIEIDPSERAWTGGVYSEGHGQWLHNLENNPAARAAFRHNTWNRFRIVADGQRIRTWINDVPAADFQQADVPSGFIALQVHSIGDEQMTMQVRWRNIRLQDNSKTGVPTPPQSSGSLGEESG